MLLTTVLCLSMLAGCISQKSNECIKTTTELLNYLGIDVNFAIYDIIVLEEIEIDGLPISELPISFKINTDYKTFVESSDDYYDGYWELYESESKNDHLFGFVEFDNLQKDFSTNIPHSNVLNSGQLFFNFETVNGREVYQTTGVVSWYEIDDNGNKYIWVATCIPAEKWGGSLLED